MEEATRAGTMAIKEGLHDTISSRDDELITIYAQSSPLSLIAQTRRPALDNKRRRPHTPTAHIREHAQVIAYPSNRRVPFGMRSDSRENLRIRQKTQSDEELLERSVRQIPNESTERDGDDTERERNTPFAATDTSHLEGSPTNKDNNNLNSDLCTKQLAAGTRISTGRNIPSNVIPMK